jgi:hypothetical protein
MGHPPGPRVRETHDVSRPSWPLIPSSAGIYKKKVVRSEGINEGQYQIIVKIQLEKSVRNRVFRVGGQVANRRNRIRHDVLALHSFASRG